MELSRINYINNVASSSQAAATENISSTRKLNSLERCTQKELNAAVISSLQGLCKGYQERLERAKNGDLNALKEGPCSGNVYFDMCENDPVLGEEVGQMVEGGLFLHGKPPVGMEHHPNARSVGGKHPMTYIAIEGVRSTEILDSIVDSFCFLDSRMALQVAIYMALRQKVGDLLFNWMFDNQVGSLVISSQLSPCLFVNLVTARFSVKGETFKINVGEIVSGLQCEHHSRKELMSETAVMRGVCLETSKNPKYLFFGLDYRGVTKQELNKFFVDEFNHLPFNERLVPAAWWPAIMRGYNVTTELLEYNADLLLINMNMETMLEISETQFKEKFSSNLSKFMTSPYFGQSVIDIDKVRKFITSQLGDDALLLLGPMEEEYLYTEELEKSRAIVAKKEQIDRLNQTLRYTQVRSQEMGTSLSLYVKEGGRSELHINAYFNQMATISMDIGDIHRDLESLGSVYRERIEAFIEAYSPHLKETVDKMRRTYNQCREAKGQFFKEKCKDMGSYETAVASEKRLEAQRVTLLKETFSRIIGEIGSRIELLEEGMAQLSTGLSQHEAEEDVYLSRIDRNGSLCESLQATKKEMEQLVEKY